VLDGEADHSREASGIRGYGVHGRLQETHAPVPNDESGPVLRQAPQDEGPVGNE
jgi:hypothetical protein